MDVCNLDDLVSELENDPGFILEELVLNINEAICRRMEELNVSRSQLAEKLGVDRAYITKMLNGPSNLTLKTIVQVLHALNARLKVEVYEPCPEVATVIVLQEYRQRRMEFGSGDETVDFVKHGGSSALTASA